MNDNENGKELLKYNITVSRFLEINSLIIHLESTAENIQLFDLTQPANCQLTKATFLPSESVVMATVQPQETLDPESLHTSDQQVQLLFVCLFVCLYKLESTVYYIDYIHGVLYYICVLICLFSVFTALA